MRLPPKDREWIMLKWDKVRAAQQRADKAGNRWNKLNDEINDYLNRECITDLVQRDKIKSESLPLKDALEEGKWHSAEAQRHIADVQLFLRLRELEIL
jgi:hypothetical protein